MELLQFQSILNCQQKVGNSIINRVMDLPIKLVDLPIKHPSTYLIFHPLDREHFQFVQGRNLRIEGVIFTEK